MEKKEEKFKFLQNNYGWVVAVITGLTVAISIILRFIKYMYSSYYFSYYGLSYELYNHNELNFLYNFGFSILVLLCYASLTYCYIQLFNMKKINAKTILFNIVLILISNVFVVYSISVKYSIWQFIINLVVLIVFEVLITKIFWRTIEKEKRNENNKSDLLNRLKIFPFYLILLIFMLLFNYSSQIKNNKSYRIINDDKVIVYATSDYYLILDCEIRDKKIKIYKGKQTKIKNEKVVSELIHFDEVNLK